jgi:hypothetical protein
MLLPAALVVLVLLGGAPRTAHHWLSASFDASRPFTLTGVVATFSWTNPHVALSLDVTDPASGAVVRWMMDMGSPSSLVRLGWTKSMVTIGETVVVEGIPSRDGRPVGYPYRVTMTATGRRLRAAPPSGAATAR